ncbi:winged helix-turn-helix transcriptional regulator [Streptomyces hoynatensis]|uniref:Transcriptional regulator n=1 Tax=Streptomyces hoynatensis TaxID=1141874 RepID=A0A3A9YVG1_9ACTN|nr:helix-turn-helix domain-containing protein [Streptomyces hoynatensis]RKN40033.1 transcriptional regulator [Streptomyces hoynatensis]
MTAPRPGSPVRGSHTGRPLTAALDLFGRRWNLRIVWELREGALGFRALRQRCDGMSSSVLRQRLSELLEARIVAQRPDTAYHLTEWGRGVYQALRPLVRWSDEWAAALAEEEPSARS